MSDELKPCPFCGSATARTIHIRDGRKVACICGACSSPKFHGPIDMPNADDRAVAAWNTRAPDSRIERLEASHAELVAALERIATVDMGGGFLGAQACRQVARAALPNAKALEVGNA